MVTNGTHLAHSKQKNGAYLQFNLQVSAIIFSSFDDLPMRANRLLPGEVLGALRQGFKLCGRQVQPV